MKNPRFSTFQLILLAMFAGLIVVAKIALRLPIQLPGHSGIFAMAIIIVGARIVPQPGAASLIGLSAGIMAAFIGMGDYGGLHTLASHFFTGVATDLALILLPNPENLISASIAGVLGHFGKFLFKWFYGMITGIPIGFITLGYARTLIGYLVFGTLGGFLGGLTLQTLQKAGLFVYLEERR
jgi:ABC-type thiamin/hydroxymethylpyrimidine transport system permease subunit